MGQEGGMEGRGKYATRREILREKKDDSKESGGCRKRALGWVQGGEALVLRN